MAKFTVTIPLNFDWRGQTLIGASGTTHRIPDSLLDEFVNEFITGKDSSRVMQGFALVEDDEIEAAGGGGGVHPDLLTHDSMGLATDAELATHAAAGDPHSVYALDADLAAHEAAADPHAGYRLESADHTHASSGLQGGQIAYSNITGTPAAERAAASTTPAAIGTAAVGVGTTDARADHVHATGAGTPSTQAIGDSAATGSGPAAAMTDHKHAMPAFGTGPAAVGTQANGVSANIARIDHVHATGAGTPSTQAFGDAAATGSGPAAAMTDHKHAMPNSTAGPDADITIDAAGAAGTAATAARSAHGHKLSTYASTPAAVATSGAAGTSTTAPARGDHAHAHETAHIAHDTVWDAAGDLVVGSGADTAVKLGITVPAANILEVLGVVNGETTASWKAAHDGTNPAALGAAAPGTALTAAHRDHVHPTTGLSLTGHGAADHTDITRSIWLPVEDAKLDAGTLSTIGSAPDQVQTILLADAATQGAAWDFLVPLDWASGVITAQPVWSPATTDAVAHTVRWSYDAKSVAAGQSVQAGGTTTAWTGASAARTAALLVLDTATSTGVTPVAGGVEVFRLNVRRVGADAADTYVGGVHLLGIIITYTANQ